MRLIDFKALLKSIKEARAIATGKQKPSRVTRVEEPKVKEPPVKQPEVQKPYWKRYAGM